MRTLIRAEFAKLRTVRSSWIALAVTMLSSPAIAVLVLATSGHHLRGAPSQIASDAFGLSSVTFGIVTATWFAIEYQDRSIATTFVLVRGRARVVLAKASAAVLVGMIVAALGTAICDALAAVWLGNVALAALVGVAGVGVGGLTQSPPLAGTVMGLVWLGLSNLLASFVGFVRHYGLVAAETALSAPTGAHAYSFAGALAAIAAVAGVLLLAALRRVTTTDIP